MRRVLRSVSEFLSLQAELTERQLLLVRPWEEDWLHWAREGDEWVLHGRLAPPRRNLSVTRGGWCPRGGSRAAAADRPDAGR